MPFKEIFIDDLKRYLKITLPLGLALVCLLVFYFNVAIPLISLITIVALSFLVAQFSLSQFFLFMVFLIPFAQNQKILESEITLLIPSEPLEAIITMAFCIKLLMGYKISLSILRHPLFLVMLCYILFQYISLVNSTMLMVSIKTMVLKSCYFITFFVLCADLYFRKLLDHIQVLKTYLFALLIIGVIIFIKHLDYGLSKDISGSVTEPFYADHTIYSACLAFIIPLPLVYFLNAKPLQINFYQKFWIGISVVVLATFFFFTYCRAGWLSLLLATIVAVFVYLGMQFRGLILLILTSVLTMLYFQTAIVDSLKQNKADSNAKNASLEQQTKSVTNITSDQSNAERLNRWSCAWRMFLDKPFWGYGPGTYQFEYLSYQKKSEMTRISVTSAYNIKKGKGGTAHSEYLLLLSESGIFNLFFYLLSIVLILYYALKVIVETTFIKVKAKILVVFLGLCTYFLHAFFNNFLDTDKAALLYYTGIAAIMIEAIELNRVKKITT